MRLIRNAGAAVAVTAFLTTVACAGVNPSRPAHAASPTQPDTRLAASAPHRHYSGLAEHFEAANTSHDGRLTLAQAIRAGWDRVARHFDEIDSAHAGFVTQEQLHAYNLAHHHSRRSAGDA